MNDEDLGTESIIDSHDDNDQGVPNTTHRDPHHDVDVFGDTSPNNTTTTTTTTTTRNRNSSSSSILCRKVILAILICETAERVAYFGFRAVLVLYFTTALGYTESTAVSLCAAVVGVAYASPLLGAILADSVWGRFRTIWRFGVSYAVGLVGLTLAAYQLQWQQQGAAAADDTDGTTGGRDEKGLLISRTLTFVGLFWVCVGTGGIKPCVSAFGADQVVLGDEGEHDYDDDSLLKADDESLEEEDRYHPSQGQPTEGNVNGSTNSSLNQSSLSSNFHAKKDELPVQNQKLGGDQHLSTRKAEAIREFFNSFYVAINIGALASFAVIPVVRAKFGFGAAFLIPTIAMVSALTIFMSQRGSYKHRKVGDHTQYPPHPQEDVELDLDQSDEAPSLYETVQVCLKILKRRTTALIGRAGFHAPVSTEANDDQPDSMNETTNRRVYQDARQVLHVLPIMSFFPIFWMLYDQQASVWTLQATRLNLHGLEPEQLQLLNPLEIMILVPFFDKILYPWLERKRVIIAPLRRIEYGMFLTAVSFFASACLEHRVQTQPANSVSVGWQIPQITIITVAEILLNVTGLEFAYSQAPPAMQTLILALYLLMTSVGDGLASLLFVTVFTYLSTFHVMITCAICMLVNVAFFSRLGRRWKPYRLDVSPQEDIGNANPGISDGLELQRIHNIDLD